MQEFPPLDSLDAFLIDKHFSLLFASVLEGFQGVPGVF